ncbi:uncharacterized protein [Drosophila kikkawai]|uniref:Uncharacterized protein n=1 Tax=Drosophila kikkawai TaxID=30033 RepID=A0ABM4GPK3_DROKI
MGALLWASSCIGVAQSWWPEWRWPCAWPNLLRVRRFSGRKIVGGCYTCAPSPPQPRLPAITCGEHFKRNEIYETGWDASTPIEKPKTEHISHSSSDSSSPPAPLVTKTQDEQRKEPDTIKSKREQMRDNMQDYIFTRYFNYVKNYDKNFPKAMQLYRVFFDGIKDFFGDMKRFLKIARIANDSPQGIRALNRQELELYMQMPRDMMKVAPALIGCSLWAKCV